MPAFAGSPNREESDELYTISSIPIPAEFTNATPNDHKIKTFILQQKRKLLLSGKFVAAGHEILENEIILRWKPSKAVNSIDNPICISDSEEEELTSDRVSHVQSDVFIEKTIHIPLSNTHPRDYCRRVAVSGDAVFTVSMFKDLQTIDLKRSTTKMLQEGMKSTNVQDACMLDDSLICATKDNISIFNVVKEEFSEYPTRIGLTCLTPVHTVGSLALIAGTDSGLTHWQFSNNRAKYRKLDHSVKTRISAVALRDEDTVISSSGRKVRVFDMRESKSITEGVMSNDVQQLKVNSDSPNLLAMEVSHLDRQIHLFDYRIPLFTKPPVLEMGYRIPDTSQIKNSRFVKGDMFQNLYARGYEDGTLNLFDLRRNDKIVTTVLAQRKAPVVHCIFHNANSVYAVGKNTFSFIDFGLNDI